MVSPNRMVARATAEAEYVDARPADGRTATPQEAARLWPVVAERQPLAALGVRSETELILEKQFQLATCFVAGVAQRQEIPRLDPQLAASGKVLEFGLDDRPGKCSSLLNSPKAAAPARTSPASAQSAEAA